MEVWLDELERTGTAPLKKNIADVVTSRRRQINPEAPAVWAQTISVDIWPKAIERFNEKFWENESLVSELEERFAQHGVRASKKPR
jgi:hypothetical protein